MGFFLLAFAMMARAYLRSRYIVKRKIQPTRTQEDFVTGSTVRTIAVGLLLLSVMAVWAPTLPSLFRRRLRSLLDTQRVRQVALAEALELSQARISKILKTDAEAGTITIERLEHLARFLRVSPAELLRGQDDAAVVLTKTESDILSLIREMPAEQQSTLHNLLAFTFSARQEARHERALLRTLRANMARELEQKAARRPPK